MSDTTASEGMAITGEVTVGFPAQREGFGRAAYGNTEPATARATWLVVHPDGTATARAGKVEYGQGIRSGLAVEVADELRLPLDRVEVILGDTDRVPWDMGTFGSQSTARVGLQLRKAAATAREALLGLAGARRQLLAEALVALDGLGSDYQSAVIIIVATTDGTLVPATYRYQVTGGRETG